MRPGIIATDLLHEMFPVGGDSPEHGARNVLHVAALDGDNGTYYDESEPADPNPVALDVAAQERLHELTAAAVGR